MVEIERRLVKQAYNYIRNITRFELRPESDKEKIENGVRGGSLIMMNIIFRSFPILNNHNTRRGGKGALNWMYVEYSGGSFDMFHWLL